MYSYIFIGLFILSFVITRVVLPGVVGMITRAGFVRPNYKGDLIPVGVGLVFFLATLLPAGLVIYYQPLLFRTGGLMYLLAVGVMTLLGLTDDIFGSRSASGLKGHFIRLFHGELTTGALKALTGGLLALVLSLAMGGSPVTMLVNTMVMALSINAVNLLDLRPGRAGKGFLLGTMVICAIGWGKPDLIWVILIAGSLISYLPLDLKAGAMMGDTGSNALGAALGVTGALTMPLWPKLYYLLFLILFHLFTEKFSLTKIIEKNRLLSFLDRLGRG